MNNNDFEAKMNIVNWLLDHGYKLFNETAEQFANRFSFIELEMFKFAFAHNRGIIDI